MMLSYSFSSFQSQNSAMSRVSQRFVYFTVTALVFFPSILPCSSFAQAPAVTPVKQSINRSPKVASTELSAEEKSFQLNEQAVSLTLHGKPDQALVKLKESIALNPKNTTARYNIAGLYLSQGNASQAVSMMEEAVRLDENDLTLRNRLAEAHLADHNITSAISHYERIVAVEPSFERALYRLGSLYALNGQNERAEETLKRALNVMGPDPRVMNNLASVLVVLGKFSEAEPLLQKSLTIEKSPETLTSLALVYEAQGKKDQALSALNQAKELSPDNKSIEEHIQRIQSPSTSPK